MNRIMIGAIMGALSIAANAAINVIPQPNFVEEREGEYVVQGKIGDNIRFISDSRVPAEGYRLVVTPKGIFVTASDDAGRFYAMQTLRQLNNGGKIPCVFIDDMPRFKWRGLLFDDGRHFFGKETLMKTLDAMALHKLNVLHWVITQDQGWRIEIKKYPELTKKGSVRAGSPKPVVLTTPQDVYEAGTGWVNNHIQYGPYFYTQDDIREIVAYAAARHITIVPEIELPGHSVAALSAYPWLGCTGEQFEPWCRWGVSANIYCGGNDATIKFLEDVMDEVCELFPGPFIHIGGDEAPKTVWKKCPKCQKRIADLGLNGEEGLQGWMTKHFTGYLAKKGKRAVGWDEVLDGEPGQDTIIMSWRGPQGGIKAAARGNDAVMTPINPCYLDVTQGLEDDPYEYINYGFVDTLELVYKFDPTAGIPPEQQHHILGGQGNNWTEYTWNMSEYEWKMWPRMSALAECLWSEPGRKDWADFQVRVAAMRRRLVRELHINAAPLR